MSRYLQIAEKFNYILFILAVCMLPYPTRISLYAWVAWLISWLFEGRFLHKKNIQWHKGLIPILILAALFLWECISYSWAISQIDAVHMIIRHISFVGIIPIAVWGVNVRYDWNKILKFFICSSILSIVVYGVYLYIFQYWEYISEYHQLPNFIRRWSYYGDQISYTKHRLYYGTILNLAIVALLNVDSLQLPMHRRNKGLMIIFFICLFLLVLGIILTQSRANLLTLLLLCAVAIIQSLHGRIRIVGFALVVVLGITFGNILFTQHPRFEEIRLEHVMKREIFQIDEIEPRINIWYGALQTPQDYFWSGVGAGGNSEYLKPIFASFNWDSFRDQAYNAHNQYLGVLINLGIFAAILFLLNWILYPLWYNGRLRKVATLVALVLGSNMLTENMLDRIDGVIITCVTLVTISLLSRSQLAK